MKSMKKHGFLDAFPIIVNSRMEVTEGQHRLEAAKRLGIPVYYIMTDSLDDIGVIYDVNNTGQRWSLMDFVESRANMGDAEYQLYLKLCREYPLIPGHKLFMFLSGKNTSSAKAVKTGNMLIDERKSRDTLNWIYVFANHAPKHGTKAGFWLALQFIYDYNLVNQNSLLDAFRKNGNKPKLKIENGVNDTYTMLEKIEAIYNHRRHLESRIFFTNEYKIMGGGIRLGRR